MWADGKPTTALLHHTGAAAFLGGDVTFQGPPWGQRNGRESVPWLPMRTLPRLICAAVASGVAAAGSSTVSP